MRDLVNYVQGDQQRTLREKLAQIEERIVRAQGQGETARDAAERAERQLAEYLRALEA